MASGSAYDRGGASRAASPHRAPTRGPRRSARLALLLITGCARPLPLATRSPAPPRSTAAASTTRAELAAGLEAARRGHYAQASALLRAWAALDHPAPDLGALAALAQAEEATGALATAARRWSRLHALSRHAGTRAYAARRVARIVDERLPADQLEALARGQAPAGDLARSLAQQRRVARGATAAPTPAPIHPSRPAVGLLLTPDGPYRAVSELAATGALAAMALPTSGALADVALVLRPLQARDPAATLGALLREEPLVALIGACGPATAAALAAVAAHHGLPWLSLAPATAGHGVSNTLRLLPDNTARAVALADYAARRRPRATVVVLAPQSPFGREVAAAFAARATARGLRPLRLLDYPATTVAFSALATDVARLAPQVVFVADSAQRLVLIAPALARAGIGATSPSANDPGTPAARGPLLLATADGLSPEQLRHHARYLRGAVLAPGFFPVATQPSAAAGPIARYRAQQGQAPRLVDALTHDAVLALRGRWAAGARSPRALLRALREPPPAATPTLTGPLFFAADGARADPPTLYELRGDDLVLLSAGAGSAAKGATRASAAAWQ